MSEIVFDTSAYLTLIKGEEGAEIVKSYLPSAMISTVNYAQLLTILQNIGMPISEAEKITEGLIRNIIPFDKKQALLASQLNEKIRDLDLSLEERACISLALEKQCPVLTANKTWGEIELDIEVKILP